MGVVVRPLEERIVARLSVTPWRLRSAILSMEVGKKVVLRVRHKYSDESCYIGEK